MQHVAVFCYCRLVSSFAGQNFCHVLERQSVLFGEMFLFWLKLMLRSRGYSITDHRADNLVVVRKNSIENYFYIFGGKDERSQDLIQGITLAGVFFDEVALMPESFVNQATGRCSVKGSKFWFNCNPDGPYHWFKVNWIDKATGYLGKEQVRKIRQKAKVEGKDPGLKELLYLHFTMDDNLSLDEEVKARYRSMYIGVFFKRYILGLWAAAEGVIYDMFDEARHVRDIKDFFQLLINGNRYVSCDYGTQNATVFCSGTKAGMESGTASGNIIIPAEQRGSRKQTVSMQTIWKAGWKKRKSRELSWIHLQHHSLQS